MEQTKGARRLDAGVYATLVAGLPLVLLLVEFAALLLAPGFGGDVRTVRAAIIVAITLISWATGWLGEPVTTLSMFLFAALFHVVRPEVLFSGFAATAWWLVVGGSIIAIAMQGTGLGTRAAQVLLGYSQGSYDRAIALVAGIALALAFVMPSTNARVMLLVPIVMSFAEQLGLRRGGRGYTGLIVTAAVASYMPPTTILTANVPNTILLGAADAVHGVKLTYGQYLLLHFPVLGLLKLLALVLIARAMFREPAKLNVTRAAEPQPFSRDERYLAVLLALALALFATDFLHHVSPAWVALATGLLCLTPPINLISAKNFSERGNLVTLIYIAGIFGLGALIVDTGLSQRAAGALLGWAHITPGNTVANVGLLTLIGSALQVVTTSTGLPAILTPLASGFADASALPLLSILMLQVIVFSTVLLPFQSPPMMIGLQIGGVGVRDASRLCLALAAVTVVVLWPLDFLWWRVLGYLP